MMHRRNQGPLMWAEAVDLLERAERMQRQFFRLAAGAERPRWEPPVDVYSRGDEILVEVALPGVPVERVELVCAPGELIVRGERRLPSQWSTASIHRIEIPYGHFERRLALPAGTWALVDQEFANGCLQLLLARR
jgi:HSP20 family molecular chaperone IbpA